MAIARSGTPTNAQPAAGTSHVINKPSGVSAGDICVIGVAFNGSPGTVTWPTGFTGYGPNTTTTNPKVYTATKKLDGTEGTTFTVTITNSVASGMACECYSGCDQTTWHDATPVVSDSAGGTSSSPSVTGISTVTANTMLVAFIGINSSTTSITENDAKVTQVIETGGGKMGELDDGILTGTGASGSIAYTLGAARAWAGISMALRPAAAGSAAGPLLDGRLVKHGVLQGRLVGRT
jgi:hypothetical protein